MAPSKQDLPTGDTQAAILQFLCRHHYDCFENRRSYHWKVNFSLWAGIVAVAGLVVKSKMHPDLLVSILGSATVFLVYVLVWMPGLKKAHAVNKTFYERCTDMLVDLIMKGKTSHDPGWLSYEKIKEHIEWGRCKWFPKKSYWIDWSFWMEICLTLLLLSAAVLVTRAP